MDISREITFNATGNSSQNVDVTKSDKVALIMGAFSIASLFIVSIIFSFLHAVFF